MSSGVITSKEGSSPSKPPAAPSSCCPTQLSEYRAFEVRSNDILGRYAVASRDLEPGDLILKESAATFGPKQNSTPVCLGCTDPITKDDYRCRKCRYPLCSMECETHPMHKEECSVLAAGGGKSRPAVTDFGVPAAYLECIVTLRVLLLRESNPDLWERVLQMDSSPNHWNSSELYSVFHHNVVSFLRNVCKVDVDEKTLHRIGGILVTNAFEARAPTPGVHVSCVFPDGALIAHSCQPNIHHTVDQDYTMFIRAATHINKGDTLYTSYTHSMVGTQGRRDHLRYSKFFDCRCARCEDPTELGTFLSALRCCRCPSDPKGFVLPPASVDDKLDWQCTDCSYKVKAANVRKLGVVLLKELDSLDTTDPIQFEMFIRKYSNVLHHNHYILFDARHRLSQLYGRTQDTQLHALNETQLRRKIELCEEVIRVTTKCIPGIARITGLAHYELQAPQVVLSQRLYKKGVISRTQLNSRLQTSLQHLNKAVFMLGFEPATSLEGSICKVAKASLKELEELIRYVKNLPEGHDTIAEDDIESVVGSFQAVIDLMK